ncbi:discoidin domain-containing protein [Paenibacillus glycanilyticus]|uniref:galactose-binding domain-containing protein n=1 Tax=Paenibacillus glycanilyticus TaxID=126569 RepID=UPI00203B2E71|nr:discoidin domain-containing protein [Paenibacillus glycanilyticus]MCM3626505.1 discoidin domain-containing protein [Paenibacillus glycanilyticus]
MLKNRLFIYVLTLALLALQLPFAAAVSAASQTYEAESATRSGGVVIASDHTGYTGSGFVGGYTDTNKGNAATAFTVSAGAAGSYTAALRYSNGTGSAKTLSLYINGTKLKQISLSATADWNSWTTLSETVTLNSGSNTITYKFDATDSGNVNLDNMVVSDNSSGTTPPGTNLALNKSITSNNNYSGFAATNAVDGNASTYYEGAANSYPNTLTVDLGSAQSVNAVVLRLPASWGTRTQTLSVSTSTDNSAYNTAAASSTYTFNPASSNAVTISFTAASVRYVRVNVTANSGSTGGQVSELEVYGSGGTVTPPVTPPPAGTYGATMPYDAYEAESVTSTGTIVGPNTTFGHIASEASGRKAVQLTAAGQYVQFALAKAAKGVTIRYSIPDNASGTGMDSAISMYVGGTLFKDINLTSKYSWNYGAWGTEGGEIRWSNNPNATPTTPHHLYDEVSVVLNQEYPAGTVIKLQRNATNLNFSSTANVTIDLIETEAIPAALTMPSNYVSIASYGAVANDGADDTTAINNAINAVKNSGGTYKGVWIPSGTFTLNNGTKGAGYNSTGTRLYLDSGVSMKGAGIWYSTLSGNYAGLYLRGGNVTISDFKISANDIIRDDYNGVSGVEGNGTNSTLTNLWIEHGKVGFWLTNQTNNATISNSRIRNVWADGLNLHYGTSNTTVTNNSVRNSGDDGLAMWSDTYLNTNNTFSYNTVQLPTLANNIAVYGGKDNKVIANLLTDTVVNGSGISFGTNFNPPSMTGTITVQDNVLIRTGSYHKDYGYQIGAIWAYWLNNSGKAQNLTVTVSGNTIQDSVYSAIFIEEPAPNISVTYASNTIINAGTYGVYIRGTATGSSAFNNNTVNGAPSGKFSNTSASFTVTGTGNNW